MEKIIVVEVFKAFFVMLIIYIEQSRYESKANQFLLSDSSLIPDKNNYNPKLSENTEKCSLYPKNLGKFNIEEKFSQS